MIPGCNNPEKLLSHRARGFAKYEHSLSAVTAAINSSIQNLEIDTRVSEDHVIYVHHNPLLSRKIFGKNLSIGKTNSDALDDCLYPDGSSLVRLNTVLSIFSDQANSNRYLYIDIKDSGYEQEHLELVYKHSLEKHIIWVTWMPQCCLALWSLDKTIPIVLSHWNTHTLGSLGQWLSNRLANGMSSFGNYVRIGANRYNSPLGKFSCGYQHSLVCYELPDELEKVLTESRGGICVHTSVAGPRLYSYCKRVGLKLQVFSANSLRAFNSLSSIEDVDMIYCNEKIGRLFRTGDGK